MMPIQKGARKGVRKVSGDSASLAPIKRIAHQAHRSHVRRTLREMVDRMTCEGTDIDDMDLDLEPPVVIGSFQE